MKRTRPTWDDLFSAGEEIERLGEMLRGGTDTIDRMTEALTYIGEREPDLVDEAVEMFVLPKVR